MNVRRTFLVALVFSGCGPLELGSYAGDAGTGGGTDAIGGGGALSGSMPGGSSATGAAGALGGSPPGGAGGTAMSGTSGAGSGGAGSGGAGSGGVSAGVGSGGSGGSSSSGTTSSDRSCRGLEGQCAAYGNCCMQTRVESEDFILGSDQFAVAASVTLFHPDVLEVTVGRFENFVEAYDAWLAAGNPLPGAGEHTFIRDTGWNPDWRLPVSRARLEEAIMGCSGDGPTYAERATNPELAMNCVSYFEAFAFCIWADKRLLTEAEWELAAKGGSQDRTYPWGDQEPTRDLAVYGCVLGEDCVNSVILPVGSKPLGTSRDGLQDLAGNVSEWVFDAEDPYQDPCVDCANVESENNPKYRVFRGGGYTFSPTGVRAEVRNVWDAAERNPMLGFRCARSVRS
ncbi:MAG TPA: SUMF1/EgtB/PvdO family nonheme iron enzyme [Polyangiaceae bacterium]